MFSKIWQKICSDMIAFIYLLWDKLLLYILNNSILVWSKPLKLHLCNAMQESQVNPQKSHPLLHHLDLGSKMSLVTHCISSEHSCASVCHRISLKKATKRMDWTHVIFVQNDASSTDMRQFYLIPFCEIKSSRCRYPLLFPSISQIPTSHWKEQRFTSGVILEFASISKSFIILLLRRWRMNTI